MAKTRRRRGPKGRRKGYTRPSSERTLAQAQRDLEEGEITQKAFDKISEQVAAEEAARASHVTRLHGIVGTVTGLAVTIESRLREQNRNWGNLAADLHVSRQYLVDAVAKDQLPAKFFYQVCDVLDLDPTTLMTTE